MDDLTSSEAMYNKHKKTVDENHLLLKFNRKMKKKDKENPVTITVTFCLAGSLRDRIDFSKH
jgi:hypothetical protein